MTVRVEIIPESEVQRPARFSGFVSEVHELVSKLTPGQVVRVQTDSPRVQGIGSALGHYKRKCPWQLEIWKGGAAGVYYVKRLEPVKATSPQPAAAPLPPVKLPDPGRCPRCNGQLGRSRELDGLTVKCMACGFEPVETPADAGITPLGDRLRRRGPSHGGAAL